MKDSDGISKIAVALTGPRMDGQTVTRPGTPKPFSESQSKRIDPEELTSLSSAGPITQRSQGQGAKGKMPVPGYEPGFLGLRKTQGTPNAGLEANQTSSVAQVSGMLERHHISTLSWSSLYNPKLTEDQNFPKFQPWAWDEFFSKLNLVLVFKRLRCTIQMC